MIVAVDDNVRDMLVHIARYDCVSKGRVLAYLNCLGKYYRQLVIEKTDVSFSDFEVVFR